MRKMKKFMSLLLAAVMVLSMMTVNVFAEETGDGSITITDAKKEETYSLYRIFELTLGGYDEKDKEYGTYSYKVTKAWENFFAKGADGAKYIELDNHGYIASSEKLTASNAAAFAELAAIYAEDLEDADAEQTISADGALEFDNLPLGYYLIHSTYGSSGICALKSTDKEVEVTEKNMQPVLKKEVKEDSKSGDAAWGEVNDAEYGEVVDFKITIEVEENASGYVLTDTLPAKMTLVENSIDVELPVAGTVTPVIADDNKSFTIEFGNLDTTKSAKIVVTYSATVDADAPVNTALVNTATLNYDVDGTDDDTLGDVTIDATTETYTWDIDVYKFTGTEKNKTDLAGAEFVLMNKEKNAYYFYGEKEVNDEVVTVMDWVTDKDKATVLTSGADGIAVYGDLNAFIGLDSGTYYLEEIAAPDGYNMLVDYVEVVINAITTNDKTGEVENTSGKVTSAGDEADVEVLNSTGAELPETGGIGTVIFRVGGAALIIAAGALLITKKRANNI